MKNHFLILSCVAESKIFSIFESFLFNTFNWLNKIVPMRSLELRKTARPMRKGYFDESAVPCRFTRCWTSSAEAIFEFSLFSFWVNYLNDDSPKFTTSNNFQLIKAPNNDSFDWMTHLYGVTMGNQKQFYDTRSFKTRF